MHILLKNIIKEAADEEGNENPLKVQVYCDMDGVLVNMDKGFMELSNGLAPRDYEAKNGKNSFWKLIAKKPTFWIDLEPMPDALTLWDFIKDNFKDPKPVILSAGRGSNVVKQKTDWIRKHIDPNVKVIIADSGEKKPNYTLNVGGRVTHVLVDDTKKNIEAWNNEEKHRIAILHKDAASSIQQLKSFLPE